MPESDLVPASEVLDRWHERADEWDRLPDDEKKRRLTEAEAKEREDRRAELHATFRRKLTVVPTRYRSATVHREVHPWLEGFQTGSDRGLLITGPTGVGKTHSLFGLYIETLTADPEATVEYRTVPLLLAQLRPGGDPMLEVIDVLTRCSLLVLDDLAAHKSSEWTEEVLFQLLDARYMWKRPTAFATNVPPPKLAEEIGDRLASRIAETCDVVALTGDDRRRK